MVQFRVAAINRYPVKSMRGEALDATIITSDGIPFDRGWAIKDEKSGNITGAKRFGKLLGCSARYLEGTNAGLVPHAEITLPNGRTINTDDSAVNKTLSDVLSHPVSLWPIEPADNEEHYRINRAEDADLEQEFRTTSALLPDEPLPDLSNFPPELLQELTSYASPRGTYFDAFPINLLTQASLRRLEDLLPEATVGTHRFRPNILLEDDEALRQTAELEWVGHVMNIDGVRLSIVAECPRCIMVTREQPGYEKCPDVMRTLVRETQQNFGIYATVKQEGKISVGDVVAVTPSS